MNTAAAGGRCNPVSPMLQQQQTNDPVPNYVASNPLHASIAQFPQSRKLIVDYGDVYAEEIEVTLNGKQYHVVAKCWPEDRCSSCNEQLLAAQRTSHLLKGRSTAHELLTCRVQGQGNVAISRYAGRSLTNLYDSGDLRNMLTTTQDAEVFLQKLAADLLLGLHELEELEVGLSFRDLKPDNIVLDGQLYKFRPIDFGLAIPFDGSHFVQGWSAGYFPVDLAATDPETACPYFLSKEGEWQRVTDVMKSRAGGLDSNLLGLTLVKVITTLCRPSDSTPWPAVSKLHDRYKVTADEAAAAGTEEQRRQLHWVKDMQFAQEYHAYMADKQQQQAVLKSTGLSAGAVRFLLSLLEVDPNQRPGIQEAMADPWVQKAVVTAKRQRDVMHDKEQAIAAHYAGFGAALQQAIQQRRNEQQRLEQQNLMLQQQVAAATRPLIAAPGTLLDKLKFAETDAANALQLCEKQTATITTLKEELASYHQLEQHNLMLQQQLADATRPSSDAHYDALLQQLASAQADAADARQLCQQQAMIISSLEGQVAVHEQHAAQSSSIIVQLRQQLAQPQQQQRQQQVYCDHATTQAAVEGPVAEATAAAASKSPIRPMQHDDVSAVPIVPMAAPIDRPHSLACSESLQQHEAEEHQAEEELMTLTELREAAGEKSQQQQQLQDVAESVADVSEYDHSNSNAGVAADGEVSSIQVERAAHDSSTSGGYVAEVDGMVADIRVEHTAADSSRNSSRNSSQRSSSDSTALVPRTPALSQNGSSSNLLRISSEAPEDGNSQVVAAASNTAAESAAQSIPQAADNIAELPLPNSSGATAADQACLECVFVDDADWIAAFTMHADVGAAGAGGLVGGVSAAIRVAATSFGLPKPYDLFMSLHGWMAWLEPLLRVVGGSPLERRW